MLFISLWAAILTGFPVSGSSYISPDKLVPVDTENELISLSYSFSGDNQITIPLRQVGKLMIVEAFIDSIRGNFILDTGAPGLVLNKTYFRDYKTVYNQEAGGVTGEAGAVLVKKIEELRINNLIYKDIRANVTDLSHIENKRGVKILGLFGVDLLKEFGMLFNFPSNQLELYELDKKGNPLAMHPSFMKQDDAAKITLINKVMMIHGEIAGKKLSFCLDTGAEMTIINSQAPQKCLQEIHIIKSTLLNGVGNRQIEVLHGELSSIRIGKEDIKRMPTLIADLAQMGESFGIQLDGMLGYDFFNTGEIYLNLKLKSCVVSTHKKKN